MRTEDRAVAWLCANHVIGAQETVTVNAGLSNNRKNLPSAHQVSGVLLSSLHMNALSPFHR